MHVTTTTVIDQTSVMPLSQHREIVRTAQDEAAKVTQNMIESSHRSTLLDHLIDGRGWDLSEVNELLDELGLERVPERVKVTAMVEVTFYVEPSRTAHDPLDPAYYQGTSLAVDVGEGWEAPFSVTDHEGTAYVREVVSVNAE